MILLLLGLLGLWLGTKWIISGSIGIAKRFNLSHSFVGMAILAVGTDLPEVFVTLKASSLHLRGIESSGIITGNAIGSSFSQITIILGVSGLFLNFKLPLEDWKRNSFALVASMVLLFLFGWDGIIRRWEGLLLLMGYLLYYILLVINYKDKSETIPPEQKKTVMLFVFYLICGLAILIFSSHLVVGSAINLAEQWGVAQSFIGIAIIGLGTSLPELAVSLGAALRKSVGLSIGNIIGSNIFDGLVPIGLGGVISTTNFEGNLLRFDLPVLAMVTLLVLIFLRTRRGISQMESITLILIYLIYIIIKLIL